MIQGSNPTRCKSSVSPPNRPNQLWYPPSFLYSGYQNYFTGVKRQVYVLDHSPPFGDEVKKRWSYASAPPICLLGVDRDFTSF